MYLHRAQQRVRAASFPDESDIHPCTAEEVDALEAKLGQPLPGAVREFLLWCGKGLGEIWSGARCLDYDELMNQFGLDGAREKLAEAGLDTSVLENALVIQFDEDAQFSFVKLNEGDDPPVYGLNEGEPLERHCDHFSDYVNLIVAQEFGVTPDDQREGPGAPADADAMGSAAQAQTGEDIIPAEWRSDPALRDADFGSMPPSIQQQLGKPQASFRASSANVVAGVIFGVIFLGFGLVLSIWLLVQAGKTGFNLPFVANQGMSWVILLVAELLSWAMAVVGVVMIRRLLKTSGDCVFVGDGGLCLMRKSTYEMVPWSAVAEIEELVIKEHAPVKWVGGLIPAGKDRMYDMRMNNGKHFLFNSTNIRNLALFRAILERVTSIYGIPWSVLQSRAPGMV
ncbi:MAG TPA: SMI1/KNR4 family protein [Verrucomicrobiae bacterium]